MTTRRTDEGFTLTEILVALTIFAFAVAGIVALIFTTVGANAAAMHGTAATGVAERFVEQFRVRQLGWQGINLASEAPELNITQDAWTLPAASSGDPWADGNPHDAQGGAGPKAIYCLHYRTHWLPPGTAVGGSNEVAVVVRVAYTTDGSESWPDCSVTTVDNALIAGTARAVVLPTLLRSKPL